MEAITCLPQNQHSFSGERLKDECVTEEGRGKFMKNALYVEKGTTWAEATLNSEKNQASSPSHC